eukprot:jgi/Botrbrau1/22458/Bobra.0091s0060.1
MYMTPVIVLTRGSVHPTPFRDVRNIRHRSPSFSVLNCLYHNSWSILYRPQSTMYIQTTHIFS